MTGRAGAGVHRVDRGAGFTLVETLVALVVLEVGVLGVVSTLVLAARTMSATLTRERAVVEAQAALDSLRLSEAAGDGSRAGPWGEVRWSLDAGGRVRVEARPAGLEPFTVVGWTARPSVPDSP